MNVLIDTNVVLDSLATRVPFAGAAEKVVLLAANHEINACITASSVTDIHYLLKKHLRDGGACRQVLRKTLSIFKILDVTGLDCRQALDLPMPDFEDAILAVCGKRHQMDYIITRNLKDFDRSPVRAISPNQFLSDFLGKNI